MPNKMISTKIGLLPTGHRMYWSQYPELKSMGLAMYKKLLRGLSNFGEVITPGLVDTRDGAIVAAELFTAKNVDILLIFPFGYTTGMMIIPVIQAVNAPICLINAHEDASYDYKTADTAIYLHHEGTCCIPEYAGALILHGKKFRVVSGHFGLMAFWDELLRCCNGAGVARAFADQTYAVIGNTYTDMIDMPVDEHRILKTTGRMLCRPEVEEVEEAYKRVTITEIKTMLAEFRNSYQVDETVKDAHLEESAKIAVAFEGIIRKYDIGAFGYYWWGEKQYMTEIRAQAALGVSRLAAMSIPGVTEGDVKAAMAMKIINFLGGGGMFLEFFSADYDGDFILMGHDGPGNIHMAEGKPRLTHLDIHHGKTGKGLGIDFQIKPGVCTLLNITQLGTEKTFKLIYSIGEVVSGEHLMIGNPNCCIRVNRPIPEFINAWCQEGPGHHSAMGLGDYATEIEILAEKLGFDCVRV